MGPRAAKRVFPHTVATLADGISARLRATQPANAPNLHRLRRQVSRELEDQDARTIIAVARLLVAESAAPGARFIACALVSQHRGALAEINVSELEDLGRGLGSWGDVDVFACWVAGRAWRDGAIRDRTIHRWARSRDRWWRRAALVATVPLNVRSQGGAGDRGRTLGVCELLVADHDDMIVKAMSWALRELATRDPQAVTAFVARHERVLAARVRREVLSKLQTGRKSAPRRLRE